MKATKPEKQCSKPHRMSQSIGALLRNQIRFAFCRASPAFVATDTTCRGTLIWRQLTLVQVGCRPVAATVCGTR